MSFKVAAWNSFRLLTDENTRANTLEQIKCMDADVAILSEAYGEGEEKKLAPALESLVREGYKLDQGLYSDSDRRKDRHGYLVATRINSELRVAQDMRHRSVIKGTVVDPDTHVPISLVGVHLDDRSEESRLNHAKNIARFVGETGPAIIAGDLNSFDANSRAAKLLRRLAPLAKMFPEGEPIFGEKTPKLGRIGSLGRRVCEMAEGSTLAYFESLGFEDADPDQQPTYTMFNQPLLQIDHIMTRDLRVSEFTVISDRAGSDHFPITAVINS